MEIGQIIKKRREELGMSQDELAKKVGYKSRSSINKIEVDGRGLPQSKIVDIAKALQTTPAHLMGWDDSGIDEKGHVLASEGERDIEKVLSQTLDQLLSKDGLMFDGKPATPEAIDSIMSAIQIGLEMAKKKNATNIVLFTDVNKAKEYLRSQKQLAAFNGNIDDVPDEDILEIANALRKKN